ncbi:Two component regulator propeller [Mucilaginibacter gossypiicola]|uniref:histidine kinase n=1 Tax=Mucilaginibacter gossypiicola TaxID=551995 RepID=A0A1H8LR03_9SPHI|nr:hybrid sensor histidine kinase/response regulator [Mucilaginibacter gossypiicola]SEO07246.1 Two component regulator propeller [Mucilaginibacter gossypiicola]
MESRKLYVLILVMVFMKLPAMGQSFSFIGIEQGLSNNTVTSIHKDKLGFMWFGTLDGLNRYDGNSFKVFRNKFNDVHSLPNDIINTVTSDRDGNIWAGTPTGVGVLDSRTMKFSRVLIADSLNRRGILASWIYAIKQDMAGNILIGSANFGLSVYSIKTRVASVIPLVISSRQKNYNYTVNAITFLGSGTCIIAVDKIGLCIYNARLNVVIPVSAPVPAISCIRYDNHGRIWLGTRLGLYYYNVSSHEIRKYKFRENELNNCWITDMVTDKNDHLWATTDGFGIADIKTDEVESYTLIKQGNSGSLSSNAVYSIYVDELSRKWIGTLRGGIDVIDKGKNQFKSFVHNQFNSNSLVYDFTFSFCEDKNKNVWIGTDGGGLSVWDRETHTFRNNPFRISNGSTTVNSHISSIIKDDQHRIWLSAYGDGIFRYNESANTLEPVVFEGGRHNAIWKLYADRQHEIWASCLTGLGPLNEKKRLFKFDQNLNRFVSAPFAVPGDVLSITDDQQGGLWLGTFNGVMHVNLKTGSLSEINLKTAVRSLFMDRSGKLWIGTYGRGLFCWDNISGKLTEYNEDVGLCNNKVLNIEEDKSGNIWLSTYNGLSKLIPGSGHIENFYTADGLQSNQFYYNASTKLSDGQLLFGGIKGFSIFAPDSIKQFYDFPAIQITGIRIDNSNTNTQDGFIRDNESIYTTGKIELPYEKAILSIDYVALEYSQPQKIQYAYKLEGRDKNWNFVNGTRSINYSRLGDGNYLLRIKSTNASGIWNTRERTISITVLPPWFRTWWAYMMYLGFAGFSIFGYLYYHRKQTRLEYEVKLTKELNEKKISFFTNISHELRTPLTLIVNPIKDLLQSNGSDTDLIDISSIYRNSRRLLSLVDQLLLFRASESEIPNLQQTWLNLKEVCHEVFLCFNNQVKEKKLQYTFSCDEHILAYADREKLEIVLFNLLSNAIKYTPEYGAVELKVFKNKDLVGMQVSDTGNGIPAETGEKLFEKFYRVPNDGHTADQSGFGIGLFLAKKYMEIQNGSLSYSSVLGKGSVFILKLPVNDLYPDCPDEKNASKTQLTLLQELIADTSVPNHSAAFSSKMHVKEILGDIVSEKPVILLIDDDREMRKYLRQLLVDLYTVYEADNTESGFKIVLENEPDIIVCDVIMKGTSGVDFCSKMKESPTFSHIPIILLTGTSSPEIKLKGIECGADDYITKPFESELLVARIKSMLKGRGTLKDYFFNEITLRNHSFKIPAEYSEFLSRCIRIVEDHLEDDNFSIKVFTDEIGMSRSKLFRKIKSISGLSNTEFIRYIRLRKAAELMISTDLQIKEIAFQIGFQDIKYFREQFFKLFEMNPSDFVRVYRKNFNRSFSLSNSLLNQKK